MLSTFSLAAPAVPAPAAAVDLRQLRHHTKNALQRILCQLAKSRELQDTPAGQRLVSDLERRVHLSSTVSDALFGLTRAPGPLAGRLEQLGEALVELLGDEDQLIRVSVFVDPATPATLDDHLLRIANEFIGNAVKHGLYARSVGHITVRVEPVPGRGVRLEVLDDGWGFRCAPEQGEGMRLAQALAADAAGAVTLGCRGGLTLAAATLHPA